MALQVVAKNQTGRVGDRRSSCAGYAARDGSRRPGASCLRSPRGPLLATRPARARRGLSRHVRGMRPGFRRPFLGSAYTSKWLQICLCGFESASEYLCIVYFQCLSALKDVLDQAADNGLAPIRRFQG